ncbi:MAG: hypothetical protein KF746_23965 [Chitinophagaceae bacterium]|nr:hypothetical protein [Chitinophagaceae bacterium]
MKKVIYTLVILAVSALHADARIWRVNNTPGINADFNTIAAAVTAAAAGDTIYIEGSTTNYSGANLNKKLVFIGTGYLLSGANSNAGLQANPNPANIGSILLDSAASGSVFLGLSGLTIQNLSPTGFGTDNITISRCQLSSISLYYSPQPGTIADGWNINKSYIGTIYGNIGVLRNWNVSNNIFVGSLDAPGSSNTNLVVRNNVFRSTVTLYNGYFANNIIYATVNLTNVVVKNNLAIGSPGGFTSYVGSNGNSNGHTDAAMFQGLTGNSTDGQWRLAAGSPAIGAGLTIGAVVNPDAGAFGGPDPYRLSGIANIPTIYSLTVPASIPSGSNSMTITFSSRNNN